MKHIMDGVNWELLQQQKLTLITLLDHVQGVREEHLAGLISFIDHIQDYMVDNKLKTFKEVFNHDVH
ncbi:MAG: hypothetical protein HC880_05135 [Bacteroidia bacterium]|nr:hypothetical protein [Bacteroidia bacterium]